MMMTGVSMKTKEFKILSISRFDFQRLDSILSFEHQIIMPTLTLPLNAQPQFSLLALALLHNAEIAWDAESGENGVVSYGDIKGLEQVRAELEKNVPGKEVRTPCSLLATVSDELPAMSSAC